MKIVKAVIATTEAGSPNQDRRTPEEVRASLATSGSSDNYVNLIMVEAMATAANFDAFVSNVEGRLDEWLGKGTYIMFLEERLWTGANFTITLLGSGLPNGGVSYLGGVDYAWEVGNANKCLILAVATNSPAINNLPPLP